MKMPIILGAWALLAATSASAALVYDNNVGSTFVNAGTSDANRPFFQADEFRLAQATSVTSITWRGIYAFNGTAPSTDEFTIAFYADNAGLPQSSPFAVRSLGNAVGRVDSGLNLSSYDVYAYGAEIAPLLLEGDTVYWISIFNNTFNDSNDDWFWLRRANGRADPGARSAQRRLLTDNFIATAEQYDFQIRGNVIPEPASLALVLAALCGLAAARRRA